MSKLSRLRDNIAALKHVFAVYDGQCTNLDYNTLSKYTGFGGMTFILNPLDSTWSNSDQVYEKDTVELYDLLKLYSTTDKDYKARVQSLKNSVLTAYYTPLGFVKTLTDTIYNLPTPNGHDTYLTPKKMLDPAAGMGVFMDAVSDSAGGNWFKVSMTAFEKDILTSMLLKAKMDAKFVPNNGRAFVYCDGFENFPKDELGMYDLVATNVPFGNIQVYDPAYSNSKDAVRRDAAKMIHRYYVLKGLDCLHNGGLLAYIITSNYLNNDGAQIREVLKGARLIGAYRLANNLFKESGTEVGTDLLVLQKEEGRASITPDESMLLTQYEDGGCRTNMYFTCYPDHIISTSWTVDTDAYGKRAFVYMHRGGVEGITEDMSKVLAADLAANLDVKLFQNEEPVSAKEEKREKTKEEKVADYKEKFRKSAHGKRLAELYACYKKLYEYEATEQVENTELRKELNELYDKCVASYGMLNPSVVTAAGRHQIEAISNDLLGLERWDDSQSRWVKADILLRPIAFSTDDLHSAGTPQEALAHSLNDYGKPDLKYMSSLTGMSEEDLLEALNGEVFYDPMNGEYEIKAKFVCGNVIEKIDAIKRKYDIKDDGADGASGSVAVQDVDPRVLNALSALEAAVPTPIPFDDLDFNLGERWVNPGVYARFASEFFEVPAANRPSWQSGTFKVDVKYNPLLDQFAASANYSWNEKIRTQYSVTSEASGTVDGIALFIHALQNTCPKMMKYKRDKQGRCMYNDKGEHLKEEDPEKTQLANTKIEEMRQAYVDWLQRQPKDFRDKLADVYNRRFNCFVKPTYDGSHQTFPGIDMKGLEKKFGIKHIYGSQKDCVWMLICNGGGICDHEVGSGKTLIMCMAAHEMKRLGMCHKPMIIGLKANVSAIAETYRTAYPQAKILFAREKDYSGAERVNFFNNAKNNDYDCIIMSHDQFSRIPQSDEIQMQLLQDELKQLEDSLNIVEDWNWSMSSRVRRGLEMRKRNMEAKIRKLQEDISNNKDDVVDFYMLGIDHIFVDESHQFKNLGFSTRHDRVAGMGNTEGSKRAFNLLMAIRTIQNRTGRDLGATFLSGTTVTNSLTELYSLFRYLRPMALEKQGITCFDAWAAIFTKKSQEFEFSITNQIVLKERFRYFIKVPELAMFYNEITDFRTAEDVGIERPEKHAMLLNIKPTPDQEEYIGRLMKFAQNGDFSLIGIDYPTDKQQKAKMLYATDLARKMSLDMRMIDPSYPDHPRSKASRCATLIKRYYDKYDAQKGTQLVFSDLSTWQNDTEWSVYGEIKKKLVEEFGIPASEVRFIQECKCDSKKQQLIDDVNKGKVRVLFGSTSMLGTGVNAQKRVVAVHHLDTPWRPSDLEQRDGRAIRKGNEIAKLYADNKVDIIIYAVERSLDSYKFNLLHCKQTFINQLKRGQLSIRTLDEGSFDENTGMNFSEYMAILSGNTDLLERAKLEKKIAALEGEKKNFLREHREQELRIERLTEENKHHERNIADAKSDLAKFNKAVAMDDEGNVINSLVIDGYTVPADCEDTDKALGEQLLKIADTFRTGGDYQTIGNICGFPVVVKTIEFQNEFVEADYQNLFYVKGARLVYSYNDGKLNRVSARTSAHFPLMALQRIPSIIDQWSARLDSNKASIEQLTAIIGQTWSKEEELRKLRSDLGILDRKINDELNGGKKNDTGSDDRPGNAGSVAKAA